jgi:glycosyltransferase involved in cell wall biosynthesis
MHILFLTHYFPPEVNAPASRTFENCSRWVKDGHRVTVLTCAPNHPKGVVYPGYSNKWSQWEEQSGVSVLRVKTYVTANEGIFKRTLNYLSYMASATLFAKSVRDVDLVISTSPQFFCGVAGLFVARLKRRPWLLEIRDLWPESIVSVGAMRDSRVIRVLERLERFLYHHADHLVVVTNAFKGHIVDRGVAPERISVVTNGADIGRFKPLPKENKVSRELGLTGKFVVSYIGTHGMAHGLDIVLKAADRLRHVDHLLFLLVGDGADRENLLREKERMGLSNVVMLPQQPKEMMPEILAASDVCMVLLKKADLFKTVIPSKIFEAIAMERPVILGVDGESRLIVETAQCGLFIEPGNDAELADAVMTLYSDRDLTERLGRNGRRTLEAAFDRDTLSQRYIEVLKAVCKGERDFEKAACIAGAAGKASSTERQPASTVFLVRG